MQTLTIHSATILNGIIHVDYTIDDIDVHQKMYVKTLVEFVIEKELNVYCSDAILGEYTAFATNDYLVENLSEVVNEYLMENLV